MGKDGNTGKIDIYLPPSGGECGLARTSMREKWGGGVELLPVMNANIQ